MNRRKKGGSRWRCDRSRTIVDIVAKVSEGTKAVPGSRNTKRVGGSLAIHVQSGWLLCYTTVAHQPTCVAKNERRSNVLSTKGDDGYEVKGAFLRRVRIYCVTCPKWQLDPRCRPRLHHPTTHLTTGNPKPNLYNAQNTNIS